MKFIVQKIVVSTEPWITRFEWRLIKGEEDICCSAVNFLNEKQARFDIARARKSMPGVRFAKVEVIDD